MRATEIGWAVLRWLYALFFFATGVAIVVGLATGLVPPISQPTVEARALDAALHASGFMDPLIALSYLAGGAALAWRRTAPLGLILLAPPVVVIFFFDTFLAKSPIPGLLTPAVWGLLALHHLGRFRGLWSYTPPGSIPST